MFFLIDTINNVDIWYGKNLHQIRSVKPSSDTFTVKPSPDTFTVKPGFELNYKTISTTTAPDMLKHIIWHLLLLSVKSTCPTHFYLNFSIDLHFNGVGFSVSSLYFFKILFPLIGKGTNYKTMFHRPYLGKLSLISRLNCVMFSVSPFNVLELIWLFGILLFFCYF